MKKKFCSRPTYMRIAGSATMSGVGVRAGFTFCRVEIVTCLWIICALTTIADSFQQQNSFYTHGRYGKREESYAQASPFFSGSRYGRSGTTNPRGSKIASKMVEVSPRVDRFFLGSRYGKRLSPDNNDNIQQQQRQLQKPSGIFPLKRFEEALGYFDRPQSAERSLSTFDNSYDHKKNKKIISNNVNDEENSMEIPNEGELDNFW